MNFEKTITYISSLNDFNNKDKDYYNSIINFENIHFIPAIRYDSAIFLNIISTISKPKKILEIGFGSGVSSLFINKDLSNTDLFISLERDKNRFLRGKSLLEKLNINNIELLNIDAFLFLKENTTNFDFIFLDSVKREYIDYIEPLKNILEKNGILICDNILFNGKVVEEKLDVKYKNGVESLKLFNSVLSSELLFTTLFLNIGDGMSISIKK